MSSFFLLERQMFAILLTTIPFIAIIETILKNLKHDMTNALRWFKVNSLKANPNKFQFMIPGKNTRQAIILNINSIKISELLGLKIDNQQTFNYHINMLSRRATIRKYLTLDRSKLLYNAFINNQFNYASIIWIFCRKQDYLDVEKIHYKVLKIVYASNECYEELLIHNNEVSIHQEQLRTLATENRNWCKSRFHEKLFINQRNALELKKWQCFKSTVKMFLLLWN